MILDDNGVLHRLLLDHAFDLSHHFLHLASAKSVIITGYITKPPFVVSHLLNDDQRIARQSEWMCHDVTILSVDPTRSN